MYGATLSQQLANFSLALSKAQEATTEPPSNWMHAFQMLSTWLEKKPKRSGKRVLFFDELPWLATRRSGFLSAFEHFWNSWASRRADIVVVVCGSRTVWSSTAQMTGVSVMAGPKTGGEEVRVYHQQDSATVLAADEHWNI